MLRPSGTCVPRIYRGIRRSVDDERYASALLEQVLTSSDLLLAIAEREHVRAA